MTATLEVTDLRKQFSIGRPAIDGVSFAVPAGEIVVLLGPSGCGKTTTLRCVAGLEHSNLDAKLRLRLRDDLRVILKQTGMTALYVTHDQAEAVVLGDRIGVMRDGKLLQMDTPDAIYNRPADLFVANFTGATNELAGTLLSRNGQFGTVDFGEGRRGEVALLHSLGPDEKVRIALRPENISIGQHNGANIFPARVLDRRYQGTQTAYGIELFGRRLEVVELGTAARHQVGVDTQVSLPKESCWAYRDTGPTAYE